MARRCPQRPCLSSSSIITCSRHIYVDHHRHARASAAVRGTLAYSPPPHVRHRPASDGASVVSALRLELCYLGPLIILRRRPIALVVIVFFIYTNDDETVLTTRTTTARTVGASQTRRTESETRTDCPRLRVRRTLHATMISTVSCCLLVMMLMTIRADESSAARCIYLLKTAADSLSSLRLLLCVLVSRARVPPGRAARPRRNGWRTVDGTVTDRPRGVRVRHSRLKDYSILLVSRQAESVLRGLRPASIAGGSLS